MENVNQNGDEKEIQQNISKMLEEYKLDDLNQHYFAQVKTDYDRTQNRKKNGSKMSKAEFKSNFRHQFAFLLWVALMTFIGSHFYTAYGLQGGHFRIGLEKILAGKCFPSLGGIASPTDVLGRFQTLFGSAFTKLFGNLVSNPVCEAFRGSTAVIVGAIAGNPHCKAILPSIFRPLTLPLQLKKLIADVVDVVFKCFENPEYAEKVKKDGLIGEANLQKEIDMKRVEHEQSMIQLVTSEPNAKAKSSVKRSSKKSSKAAKSSRSKTQKSNRVTEIKVKAVISNKDEIKVVPDGPKITKEEFEQNLEDLGLVKVYEDGLKAIANADGKKTASKKCSVGKMKGGFLGLGTIAVTKLVVSGLFAGGTAYYNWDVFSNAKKNYDVLSKGDLAKPEHATTNFVLNMFGVGTTCAGQNNIASAAASRVFTGMSLTAIYAMSQAAGSTAGDSAESFVDYSSKIYTYFA